MKGARKSALERLELAAELLVEKGAAVELGRSGGMWIGKVWPKDGRTPVVSVTKPSKAHAIHALHAGLVARTEALS